MGEEWRRSAMGEETMIVRVQIDGDLAAVFDHQGLLLMEVPASRVRTRFVERGEHLIGTFVATDEHGVLEIGDRVLDDRLGSGEGGGRD